MVRRTILPLFLPLILLVAGPGFVAAENLTCSDKSVVASAIRTPEDVQAFVQCAYEFVQEVGFEEAQRAFHEDARWRSGAIYVVVVDVTVGPEMSRVLVLPPNPSEEGTARGPLVDIFGNAYSTELHRIANGYGGGWLYYSTRNPATDRDEPKMAYFKGLDWDGTPAAIGAGIYRPDLPITCSPEEVNAMELASGPSADRLQNFVRCAALELEANGYFAAISLSADPRWTHKSIYVFGLDRHGSTLFSGDSSLEETDLPESELTSLSDRDDLSVAKAFGETFLYYKSLNPATQTKRRKVVFVKRVVTYGFPILIGAGYYLDLAGQGGTATLRFWQAPTNLNPYRSYGGNKDAEAASLVIEPLAEYNPNGELVPVLATRIPTLANQGISADRSRITWTLRRDVVWSDGTPLTAGDVVFTWKFCTAPDAGCLQTKNFANVSSVDAVDDRTVTITFDGPTSFPYAPFVSYFSPILQASQFADCLGAAAGDCTDSNERPIGTGPYAVADFGTGDSVRYEFNPLYRGVDYGVPHFGEVILQGGGSAAAAARSVLKLSEADYAWNLQVEPDVLASLAEGGRGSIVSAFATTVERIVLNQTNPDPSLGELRSEYADGTNPHPFLTDPVVGRALSLAIDRDALVRVGYGEAGLLTCNVWIGSLAQTSTNNDECLVQNIALANQILDDAGIVDSDGDGVREREGVPLKILYQTSTNSVRQTTQEQIKGWWAEIGVETELKAINPSVYFGGAADNPDTLNRFYSDVQMYANGATAPDPEGYLGSWVTSQIAGSSNSFRGSNVPRFQSDEYDRLFAELQSTVGKDRRDELTVELNDLLIRSYSIIPLIHRGNVSAHSNAIEGVWMNAWDSELWNFETWTRRK